MGSPIVSYFSFDQLVTFQYGNLGFWYAIGSDFTAPTSIGAGGKSAPGSSLVNTTGSNPFAGVERILESESKSSKEQIPGGELNRLETRETKMTEDGGYVRSHTLSEHKASSNYVSLC